MSVEYERARLRRRGFVRLIGLDPKYWLRPGPAVAIVPDPAAFARFCDWETTPERRRGWDIHDLIEFYRGGCGGFLVSRAGRLESFGHSPQLVFPFLSDSLDPAATASRVLLAAGLGTLDPADLDLVLRFPRQESWHLLHFLAAGPAAAELLRSNPALGLLLSRFADPDPDLPEADALRQFLPRRRRDLAAVAGFPRSERWVRILAKIPPESADRGRLTALREAACCPGGDALARRLGHLSRLEGELLELLLQPALAGRCSDAFLRELEMRATLGSISETTRALREIAAMEKRLPLCPRAAPFGSLHDLRARRQVLDFLMERWRKVEQLRFPAPPLRPAKDYIEPITSPAELFREALQQRHCALHYADSVAAGERYFYRCTRYFRATLSVRLDPETRSWSADNCAGFANHPVDPLSQRLLFGYLGIRPRPRRYKESLELPVQTMEEPAPGEKRSGGLACACAGWRRTGSRAQLAVNGWLVADGEPAFAPAAP
jgi:hypothetical protein